MHYNNLNEYRKTFPEFYKDYISGFEGAMKSGLKKMQSGVKVVKKADDQAHTLSADVFLQPFRAFWAAARQVPDLVEKAYGSYVNKFGSQVGAWQNSKVKGKKLVKLCEEAVDEAEKAMSMYNSL